MLRIAQHAVHGVPAATRIESRFAPNELPVSTAAEKAAYLEGLKAKANDDRPQPSTGGEVRPRPSPPSSVLPIGVVGDGGMLLLCLASEPTTETFRTFLQTRVALLEVAPTWTIESCFRGRSTMRTTRIRR